MPRTERLKKKRNGKMKLTKSKLKQLIKEIAEEEFETDSFEGADPEWGATEVKEQWEIDMEKIMEAAVRLYEEMPLEGKEAFTENFEKYAADWRYQMREEESEARDSEEEEEDEGEYEMLPRGENPMGRGPQTSRLRRKSTNWRPGEDFYGIE
jgi:hypothetical protein